MERVTQAAALVLGTESVRVRGTIVEAGALDTFRQYAEPRLVARLDTLLSEPASSTVERVRERDGPRSRRTSSGACRSSGGSPRPGRASARCAASSARPTASSAAAASADLDAARASARRELGASVAVLVIVAGLGLLLGRSITRPLGEVAEGARMLSAGEPSSGVSYAGRDEIGEVAGAFRDVQATADRLAEQVRAMNVAVKDNRLDHRADVAAFDGRWAELLGGVNDTLGAFAELQARREQAERHADRIFELSHDLLCIAGFDGYFKRVNPAFERLLGYPAETLLSRPAREFMHPDDRAARDDGRARLEEAEEVLRFELRLLCSDGSVRRVEWSARPVPEERLIYAVGRDVTDSRRAADEQAALRRVATLVAKGAAPEEIFAAVAREVRELFEAASARVARVEADGSIAVVAAVPDASGATHQDIAGAVARAAARPAPTARSARRSSSRTACGVSSPSTRAPRHCRPARRSASPASRTSSPRRSQTPRAARRSPHPARASWRPPTRSAGGSFAISTTGRSRGSCTPSSRWSSRPGPTRSVMRRRLRSWPRRSNTRSGPTRSCGSCHTASCPWRSPAAAWPPASRRLSPGCPYRSRPRCRSAGCPRWSRRPPTSSSPRR